MKTKFKTPSMISTYSEKLDTVLPNGTVIIRTELQKAFEKLPENRPITLNYGEKVVGEVTRFFESEYQGEYSIGAEGFLDSKLVENNKPLYVSVGYRCDNIEYAETTTIQRDITILVISAFDKPGYTDVAEITLVE